jgi:hypothetical protein
MHLKFHQNNFISAYFISVSFLSDCFLQAKTGDTIITNEKLFKQRRCRRCGVGKKIDFKAITLMSAISARRVSRRR